MHPFWLCEPPLVANSADKNIALLQQSRSLNQLTPPVLWAYPSQEGINPSLRSGIAMLPSILGTISGKLFIRVFSDLHFYDQDDKIYFTNGEINDILMVTHRW